MSDKIWNNIKKSYDEAEEQVSEDLWGRLESQLDSVSEEEIPTEVTSKSKFRWMKYAAIFLIMLSVGGLLYFNQGGNLPNQLSTNKDDGDSQIESESVKTTTDNVSQSIVANDSIENSKAVVNNSKSTHTEAHKDKERPLAGSLIQSRNETLDIIKENPKRLVDNVIEKNQDVENKIQVESKTNDNNSTENKSLAQNQTYVKSNDLLFSRELEKSSDEHRKNERFSSRIDFKKKHIKKPNSVRLLGFQVYSEDVELSVSQ